MKCDELKLEPIIADDVVWGKAYYEMQEVDDVIANLKAENDHLRSTTHSERDEYIDMVNARDKEIAELKKKLMPCLNGDCILTCEVVEKYGKENAELKQKLEDVQASAYAESVDAGMRERRLRRALWIARAQRANDKARIFYFAETCGVKLNIDGYSNREKGHTRMCTARWWRLTWLKVKRKCREKAEQYK